MAEFTTSDHLLKNYQQHYSKSGPEWRRLGAQDKAANILKLCGDVPHIRVLEVGAGDDAVFQRLGELGFGDALYGIEIVPIILGLKPRKPSARETRIDANILRFTAAVTGA